MAHELVFCLPKSKQQGGTIRKVLRTCQLISKFLVMVFIVWGICKHMCVCTCVCVCVYTNVYIPWVSRKKDEGGDRASISDLLEFPSC